MYYSVEDLFFLSIPSRLIFFDRLVEAEKGISFGGFYIQQKRGMVCFGGGKKVRRKEEKTGLFVQTGLYK